MFYHNALISIVNHGFFSRSVRCDRTPARELKGWRQYRYSVLVNLILQPVYDKIAANLQHNRRSMICLMMNMLAQAKSDPSHNCPFELASENLSPWATHTNVRESSHEGNWTNHSHQCEVIIRPISRLEYPLAFNGTPNIGPIRGLDM